MSAPVFVRLPLADMTETWQARCVLTKEKPRQKQLRLYSGYGGSGCASTRTIASRKAICEVLERWAFEDSLDNPVQRTKHAFDILPSTTGMAAFPELICRQVQKKARFEAIERWALVAWWHGFLPNSAPIMEPSGIWSVQIATPFGEKCVILWKDTGELRTYGFACDSDYFAARLRALIELSRNMFVIGKWDGTPLPDDSSLIEKRLVHFATEKGRESFDHRVRTSVQVQLSIQEPKLISCAEVIGEWSRYVKVWRTVYEEDPRWDENTCLDVFRF